MKQILNANLLFLCIMLCACSASKKNNDITIKGETVKLAGTGFSFTEGPAVNAQGQVYFTDQPNDKIHIWEDGKEVSLYLEGTKRSNGMYFNAKQQLVSCADEANQIVYFDKDKNAHLIHEDFDGKHLNAPNDLWIAPNGGIYFTDPYYHRDWWSEGHSAIQETEGAYYLSPDGKITRIIDDFKKPNGLIGTPDGKTLYVADIEDNKIWKYTINSDGGISGKTFFAPHGSDGMTIDNNGNVYLTSGKVWVYNPKGELIKEIEIPESPSNVCFGGAKRDILFVTARTSIYTLRMNVNGVD